MAEESPIYLKLEYGESIESKKDLLSLEMSFLNLLKSMRKYNAIRTEELNLKMLAYKTMKELDMDIKKTKASFPFLKIPQNLQKKEITPKEVVKIKRESFDDSLESQLKEIQDRLRTIEMQG
jgi:hypothetical protein